MSQVHYFPEQLSAAIYNSEIVIVAKKTGNKINTEWEISDGDNKYDSFEFSFNQYEVIDVLKNHESLVEIYQKIKVGYPHLSENYYQHIDYYINGEMESPIYPSLKGYEAKEDDTQVILLLNPIDQKLDKGFEISIVGGIISIQHLNKVNHEILNPDINAGAELQSTEEITNLEPYEFPEISDDDLEGLTEN